MNTTILNRIKEDKVLSKIAENFPNNNIYIVGGYVRDFYLGKPISPDRDLVITDMNAKEFALKLAEIFPVTFVPLDEENHIYRLVFNNSEDCLAPEMLDVTNPLGGNLELDLRRRDLTINAIAANIKTGEVIDLFGGIADIKTKTLNYIDEINFVDDALRLLRVYRFKSTLGFNLSSELMHVVCKYTDLIAKPAKERVLYELMKLFEGRETHNALLDMNLVWFLEEIFPVVKELKQVPPNSHHHLDLFSHSVETVKQIQLVYESSGQEIKNHLSRCDFGGFSRLAHLKLAGFLHDIGKFSTWTIDKDTGRHRFIKHDDVGSKMVVPILKSLSCSNKQIAYISEMIKNHIYPSSLMQEPEVNEKAMKRYIRKLGENTIDNIILAKADRYSALGEVITEEVIAENISNLDKLLELYFNSQDLLEPLPKLLDGNEIMEILSIPQGKRLGEILAELREAQINGDVNTKEEAVQFVKKHA